MTAEHKSIMQLEKENKRLVLSTIIFAVMVIALVALLVIAATGIAPVGIPGDSFLGEIPDPGLYTMTVVRQQEIVYSDDIWDPVSQTLDDIGQSTTENTEAAGAAAQGGIDLGMSWVGSFWDGATILMVLIAVAVSLGVAINVVEENYLVAGILALVLSGAAILGIVGAYFQVLDGMFLQVVLMGGIFVFFLYEGWGKTGFFASVYVIWPGVVILAWIYPQIFLLGGYADLNVISETVAGWSGA
jgi:hypothetical protein